MSRKTEANNCSSMEAGLGYEWVQKEGREFPNERNYMSRLRVAKYWMKSEGHRSQRLGYLLVVNNKAGR